MRLRVNNDLFQTQGCKCGDSPLPGVPHAVQTWSPEADGPFFVIHFGGKTWIVYLLHA